MAVAPFTRCDWIGSCLCPRIEWDNRVSILGSVESRTVEWGASGLPQTIVGVSCLDLPIRHYQWIVQWSIGIGLLRVFLEACCWASVKH
jgi:hypothetical protein